MEFLRKLFGWAQSPVDASSPAVVVTGLSEPDTLPRAAPSAPQAPPLIEAAPSPALLDDEYLEDRFLDFLGQDPPFSALLFEPEEECCFVYYYRDNTIRKVHSLAPGDWEKKAEKLKSLDFKEIALPPGAFVLSVIISFSNFGERISVLLEPRSEDTGERLRVSRRNCIRLLNSLKPATSLTELNRVHLSMFVDSNRSRCGPGLVESLAGAGLLGQDLLDECRRLSGEGPRSLESLVIEKGVFPRKMLTNLVADWAGFRYVDIDEEERDPRAARLLGEDFCLSMHIFPFRLDEREISVAFAYPGDEEVLKEIESRASREVVVLMSAAEDIRYRVAELFRRQVDRD